MMVVGTLVFPLTAFATLFVLPGVEGGAAVETTLWLAAQILAIVALGALARLLWDRVQPKNDLTPLCDDATALLLAIIVVGLMVDVGPLLRSNPVTLAKWLAGVLVLNLAIQGITFRIARARGLHHPVAVTVYSANRNIALYLLALPSGLLDEVMLFVGCYQIPMYLTPILMHRVYKAR